MQPATVRRRAFCPTPCRGRGFLLVLAAMGTLAGGARAESLYSTQVYTSTSPATYTVPAGVSRVVIKAWGAGGGSIAQAPGGGGGYASGSYTVSAGWALNVRVGSWSGPTAVWRSSGFQVLAGSGGSGGGPWSGSAGGAG